MKKQGQNYQFATSSAVMDSGKDHKECWNHWVKSIGEHDMNMISKNYPTDELQITMGKMGLYGGNVG